MSSKRDLQTGPAGTETAAGKADEAPQAVWSLQTFLMCLDVMILKYSETCQAHGPFSLILCAFLSVFFYQLNHWIASAGYLVVKI